MSSLSTQPDLNPAESATTDPVFVARHPIFDLDQKLCGYELRPYRDTQHADPSQAVRDTLYYILHVIGLSTLVDQNEAYIQVTAQTLIQEDYLALPAERSVLLILADENLPTAELIQACQQAKREGYRIAVRLHENSAAATPLLAEANVLAVHLHAASKQYVAPLLATLPPDVTRLATEVETQEDFELARGLGFEMVEGFFFCQPKVVSGRTLSRNEVAHMRFLGELNKPRLDFDLIESLIKTDPALSYNLLKYLNSAAMGLRQRITSIRHALVLLGERPLRKWGALICVNTMGHGKPHQLLVASLVRAHFCESLAPIQNLQDRALDLFVTGLLSSIDVLLDLPMEQAVSSLPLHEEVTATLLGDLEGPLSRSLELAKASERGAWTTVNTLGAQMYVSQRDIVSRYYDALRWVYDLFESSPE